MNDGRTYEPARAVTYRDVLFNIIACFFVLLFLLILMPRSTQTDAVQPPGMMVVTVVWPEGLTADLDLWVEGPNSGPVGYSRQNSELFNLLRDDLGMDGDLTPLNQEMAVSRALPPGEYVVNLHLYRHKDALPFRANVEVLMMNGGKAQPILRKDVDVLKLNDEMTVARFQIDADGRFVPSSVNAIPKKLRNND